MKSKDFCHGSHDDAIQHKGSYAVVPRQRGQQLKDQAQLDGWLRDGSAEFVNRLCAW
jgi:hypothetical protein